MGLTELRCLYVPDMIVLRVLPRMMMMIRERKGRERREGNIYVCTTYIISGGALRAQSNFSYDPMR